MTTFIGNTYLSFAEAPFFIAVNPIALDGGGVIGDREANT
jgi:hypothetical protein